jgi:ribosomal RNA-processing protein 7
MTSKLSSSFLHSGTFEGNRVLTLQYTATSEAAHQIFFQPHRVKKENYAEETKPAGRTLFLSNLPTWASRAAVKKLFQCNGPVEEVYLQKTPSAGKPPRQNKDLIDPNDGDAAIGRGFRYGYVVYERPSSMHNAMQKMDLKTPKALYDDEKKPEVGVEKWRQEYNDAIVSDLAALMADIETRVAAADRVKEAVVEAEEKAGEEDDDGWVTVSRTSNKKGKVGKISDKAQSKVKAREARKRKRKELDNFYKYQVKESKLARMDELKEKFEEDKKRQLVMKQDRKFRPNK